jgi:hypothetical protein
MIPKVIHRIWVGGPMPAHYERFAQRWAELHPGWNMKLWGDDDFGWLENQDLFDNADKFVPADAVGQFRSDVARYEILSRFGGVYVDCDVEPQKPLDPLVDVRSFAGWEEQGTFVGNTVLGSEPNSPAMQQMIRVIPEMAKANAGRAATWISGPRVLTRVYNENEDVRDTLTVYPQGYFFPYSYSDLRRGEDPARRKYPDAYVIHHWGHQRELRGRPLVGSGNGELSVAIMAHPKRADWVPLLEAQVPQAKVVWDRKNDRWDTGARSLMAFDPDAEWHMVIQDDSLLPPDFYDGVKRMLEFVEPAHPTGLYYGRVRPRALDTENLVRRAQKEQASFIVHNGPWWGVGIVLPTKHIPDVVEWGTRHSNIPNYDRRISRWYADKQIPCYYTVPSLIEHRTEHNPSLVPGRNGQNRRAWQFVGPRSALEVDWSGPAVRGDM